MIDLRELTFGIELECGVRRYRHVWEAVNTVFGSGDPSQHPAYCEYLGSRWTDAEGRTWRLVGDASVRFRNRLRSCELVTPPLTYDDIPKLQKVIRELRRQGAKVNRTCGLHVHVGVPSNVRGYQLANVLKLFYNYEDLIVRALSVHSSRRHYCEELIEGYFDPAFLPANRKGKNLSLTDLARAWYGTSDFQYYARSRRPSQRYRSVNLHSYFYRGTVEFRIFNATLHAGRVKSYIQFSLALVAYALNMKKAAKVQPFRAYTEDAKYRMRVFLRSLGLKGPEFKTLRKFFLKNLPGSSAFRTVAQARESHRRHREEFLRFIERQRGNQAQEPQAVAIGG